MYRSAQPPAPSAAAGAGTGIPPGRRQKPPEHRRVLIIGCRGDVLITDKQGIEPGAVCRPGALDHLARSLERVFRVRVITRQRDPNSHRVILVAGLCFDQIGTDAPSRCSLDPLRLAARFKHKGLFAQRAGLFAMMSSDPAPCEVVIRSTLRAADRGCARGMQGASAAGRTSPEMDEELTWTIPIHSVLTPGR
jgi:hypothetical protein